MDTRRVIACRGVQEEWNVVGSRCKSILRCHTYGRTQSGGRLYRLRGLQVLAQPVGDRVPVVEAGERGFVTTRAIQLVVSGRGELRAPQLRGSSTCSNAEPLGCGRGVLDIQLQPHRHGSVFEVRAECDADVGPRSQSSPD